MKYICIFLGYECQNCHRFYLKRNSLLCHQLRYCGKEPQYKCPEENCSYKTHLKFNLKKHHTNRHKPEVDKDSIV